MHLCHYTRFLRIFIPALDDDGYRCREERIVHRSNVIVVCSLESGQMSWAVAGGVPSLGTCSQSTRLEGCEGSVQSQRRQLFTGERRHQTRECNTQTVFIATDEETVWCGTVWHLCRRVSHWSLPVGKECTIATNKDCNTMHLALETFESEENTDRERCAHTDRGQSAKNRARDP